MNLTKYFFFLAALYLLPLFPGFAQNEFAFLASKERFIYEPSGYASPDGTYTLFYYHKDSRNFYTFDERGEIISTIVYPFPAQLQQEKPLGIHETKNAYHYYFQSSTHRKSLEIISLGKHTASRALALLPLTTNRQEKFLQTLSLKGKLYFLLTNRRKNTLVVLSPLDGKRLERYEFELNREVLHQLRKANFSSISGDRETPFNSLGRAKAYLPKEGNLLLSLELESWKGHQEKGVTAILELNLPEEQASFRLLYGLDGIRKRYRTNTFLQDDIFIKVSANKRFFNLSFYSFPALEKQKGFSYNDTTQIALITRRLVHLEGDKSPRYVERQEVKEVLKCLNKGTLALNARPLEGKSLQLQIGSFGSSESGGVPMMSPMGGGSFSAPGGAGSIPVSYGFSASSGSSSSYSYTFTSCIGIDSLLIEGSGPESLEEKERRLIESLEVRKSDCLIQLPVSYKKSLLGHYSSKEKMFTFYLLTSGENYKASWNAPESPNGF